MQIVCQTIDTTTRTVNYICEQLAKMAKDDATDEKKINLSLDLNHPSYIMVSKNTEDHSFDCRWIDGDAETKFSGLQVVGDIRKMVEKMNNR